MTEAGAPRLKRTTLTEWHRSHGGRMAPRAGWELPAAFGSADQEHMAVRTDAGLFDLSHLGQIELAGGDALRALQALTCGDAATLAVGETQSSALTTPQGGVLDELLVFRLADEHFLLVTGEGGAEADLAWMAGHSGEFADLAVVDTSSRYALLALQGPSSRDRLQEVASIDLASLGPGGFEHGEVAGARATVCRTSWTGEDGFEILTPPASALRVWQALATGGSESGATPAGFEAADSLRLEAGKARWGAELGEATTLLEAGLDRLVAWDKPDFVGKAALVGERARPSARRLVGFEMIDDQIAGRGDLILVGGAQAGAVVASARAPFVGKTIGMALLDAGAAVDGAVVEIDVRGRRARARVVPLPFYMRPGV